MAESSELKIPAIFKPLFGILADIALAVAWRVIILRGGRGSAKSWTVATFLILMTANRKLRVLCTREYQKTIGESVHKLLSDRIHDLGYDALFKIQKNSIVCTKTGSEFLFVGVRTNVDEIKSMEGIDICWIEEGQSMSQYSIDVLFPTIRKPGSFIIITFNPYMDSDPVFVMSEKPDARTLVITANYCDNPWFPEVLRMDMERDKELDFDKYEWIWLGKCKGISAAQIFRGKYKVADFDTPKNVQFHYGMDFGFSQDPNAIIRSFVVGNTLYIDQEAWGVGVELGDDLEHFVDSVPGIRIHPLPADNARPETISLLKNRGFNIFGQEKLPIEEGIEYLRGFTEIVIHPRCVHTKEEFDLYQYKVDRVSGAILRIPVDKYNHLIDALRYSHVSRMRGVTSGSVYPGFTVRSVITPFAVSGIVYTASFATPGRTLTVSLAVANGVLNIVSDYAMNGPFDYKRVLERFGKNCHHVWFPLCKPEEVNPQFIAELWDLDVEPSVGNFFPADGEGIRTVNNLLKNGSLAVFDDCIDTINALTNRTFRMGGELEAAKNVTEMVYMCELIEYAVWRALGRLA